MGFYIIEINDKYKQVVLLSAEGELYCKDVAGLLPYTAPDLEQVRKEAYEKGYETAKHECEDCPKQAYTDTLRMDVYQKGLSDAWDAARKIASDNVGQNYSIFGQHFTVEILNTHSASECIEKIRQYEREKEEPKKEQSVTAEDVMRQYLDMFCINSEGCAKCPLNTPDFTCGRGYHFLGKGSVSDEEVRRAYAEVLAKMKETNNG